MPITLPATPYFEAPYVSAGEHVSAGDGAKTIDKLLKILTQFTGYQTLTISGGRATPTTGVALEIDTQSSAAADDLDSIDPSIYKDGTTIWITSFDANRIVTVKHETSIIPAPPDGVIHLNVAEDLQLSTPRARALELQLRAGDWYETNRIGFDNVGGYKRQTETQSPTTGSPPAPTSLVLNPVLDRVSNYAFTEVLTGDLSVTLTNLLQHNGIVAIHRSGSNGSFIFQILVDDGIQLAQFETAFFVHNGASWIYLGKASQETGGLSSFLKVVDSVTASVDLTDANQEFGVSGSAAVKRTLITRPSTVDATIVFTIPSNAPEGSWYGKRGETHTGAIQIKVVDDDVSTLNGTLDHTVEIAYLPKAAFIVEVDKQAGGVTATVKGDTIESRQLPGKLYVQKAIEQDIVTLTDAATIATDCALGNIFKVVLTDNRTLGNPTNIKPGTPYVWYIVQDAGGTNTLAFGSYFKFATGESYTASTAGNAIDVISVIAYSATELHVVGIKKGYA